ncbi:MAG: ATP-binding protein [Sandaracinaceae bacterium]|nr:MAG: anti-sigma regulatory factor [Sandaracinaceae bacterium]
MAAQEPERIPIAQESDVVLVRRAVRERARTLKLSLVEQTKLVTAASELARNALEHAGGGQATVTTVVHGTRSGVELIFEDDGPGIADVETALRDGFTTGRGLGLGLGGARRLVHEFDLEGRDGGGTRIRIVRWS